MSIEFVAWPKTPRLFKDAMVITEKIDGTNAAIGIVDYGLDDSQVDDPNLLNLYHDNNADRWYGVYAQSRNRLILPIDHPYGGKGSDNYAFAQWVEGNSEALIRVLGPGLHYGEWWGAGIARNYGKTDRTFSLFNTSRFKHLADEEARAAIQPPKELSVVPVLAVHTLDTQLVLDVMDELKHKGSAASPGYMNPEGVVVFLPSVGRCFKVTYDGDKHKWEE